jgi:hypothetical protein
MHKRRLIGAVGRGMQCRFRERSLEANVLLSSMTSWAVLHITAEGIRSYIFSM